MDRTLYTSTSIKTIAFSGNCEQIAYTGSNGVIRLVDPSLEQNFGQLLIGSVGFVNMIAYSSDDALLASGSDDKTVRIWCAKTGKLIGDPLVGHESHVTCVCFAPDGKSIASGSEDSTIRIWNITDHKCLYLIRHKFPVLSIDYSPAGRFLVSGGKDKLFQIWRLNSSKASTRKLTCQTRTIKCLKFSQNGTLIASAFYNKLIKVWNFKSNKLICNLHGHTNDITTLSFKRLLGSGSADSSVRLWNITNRTCKILESHEDRVIQVQLSTDEDFVISGGADRMIRIQHIN